MLLPISLTVLPTPMQLNVKTGKILWSAKAGVDPLAMNTGTPGGLRRKNICTDQFNRSGGGGRHQL